MDLGVWFLGQGLIRKRLVTLKDKEGSGITGKIPKARERMGGKKVKIVRALAESGLPRLAMNWQ